MVRYLTTSGKGWWCGDGALEGAASKRPYRVEVCGSVMLMGGWQTAPAPAGVRRSDIWGLEIARALVHSGGMEEGKKRGGGRSFDSGCGPAGGERPAKGSAEPGAGKRGGGPRTEAGKAVVRLNPVKHGVLSQTPVIPLVEREEDWEALRRGLFEALDVQGTLEEALADRIAGIIWRLHRAVRFESESVSRYLHDVPGDWRASRRAAGMPVPVEVTQEVVEEMDRMLMSRLLPGEETLAKVMRYETKLHRFLLQTLHQLMVVKGLRKPGGHFGVPDLDPPVSRDPKGLRRMPKYQPGEAARSRAAGDAPDNEWVAPDDEQPGE